MNTAIVGLIRGKKTTKKVALKESFDILNLFIIIWKLITCWLYII